MQVQMNPETINLNEAIISELSSSERYFFVYPRHPHFQDDKEALEPMVLVYKDNDKTTFGELCDRYNEKIKGTESWPVLSFQTQKYFTLQKGYTIGDLKKKFRRPNIDGFVLYAVDTLDQAAAISYFKDEKELNKGKVQVPYKIESADYFSYLQIEFEEQQKIPILKKIVDQICKDIQRDIGKMVSHEQIKMHLKDNNQKITIDDQILQKMGKNDEVIVEVQGIELKYIYKDTKNHLILKCQGFEPMNLEYPVFKGKKVIDILKMIDQTIKWENYAILVDDYILTNDDTIETYKEVQQLFTPSQGIINHIQGIVLNEISAFEKSKKKLSELQKVDLEKIVEKDQKNTQYRQKCESQIRKRAESAPNEEFKDINNVKPIFLYTSQLKVKGSQQKTSSIYRNMNELLRTQSFAHTPQYEYQKKWEYQFMYQVLEQLDKIQQFTKQPLYRGVSYVPDHKVGDIILYKQFNSTSIKSTTAMAFANEAFFQIESSFSGRAIFDYSYYKTQKQVLFPPYTQFQVTYVGQIQNQKKNNKMVKHIKMKQVEKKPMEKSIVNFVLWVDDKTIEGKAIWNKFQKIKKSTVMIQILSTKDLQNWLINHKNLLQNPETRISMISNMTRIEDGIKNEFAGIDAINVMRENLPKQHPQNIFLYIGNKKMALEKLQKYDIKQSQTLQVSSAPSRLKEFLKIIGVQ